VLAGLRLPRIVVEETLSPTIPSQQVPPPPRETRKDAEQRERHRRRVALIEHIVRRWNEGCHNAAELYREIRGLGYQGARTTVRDFVATLRTRDPGKPAAGQVRVRLGTRRLRMWFTRPPEELGDTKRRWLEGVLEGSPAVREAYTLLQEFRMILAERRADKLKPWLERASGASVAPLRGFARGIERDLDAVMNALTLPWSNGPVEGYIHKLKLLKRQMYGRAGIELLRKRFLALQS